MTIWHEKKKMGGTSWFLRASFSVWWETMPKLTSPPHIYHFAAPQPSHNHDFQQSAWPNVSVLTDYLCWVRGSTPPDNTVQKPAAAGASTHPEHWVHQLLLIAHDRQSAVICSSWSSEDRARGYVSKGMYTAAAFLHRATPTANWDLKEDWAFDASWERIRLGNQSFQNNPCPVRLILLLDLTWDWRVVRLHHLLHIPHINVIINYWRTKNPFYRHSNSATSGIAASSWKVLLLLPECQYKQ